MKSAKKHLILNNNDRGFTLVEMIVVLVILVLLAAIAIPALLGFIDNSRMNEDILEGRNIVMNTQSELTKLFGLDQDIEGGSVIPGHTESYNANGDVNAVGSEFTQRILDLSEVEDPYILVLGMGSVKIYPDYEDRTRLYTVYIAMYMKNEDSKPVYFYGDEWGPYYPRDKRVMAITKANPLHMEANYHFKTDTFLQYYILANGNGKYNKGTIWDFLMKQSDFQAP